MIHMFTFSIGAWFGETVLGLVIHQILSQEIKTFICPLINVYILFNLNVIFAAFYAPISY